ncbi:lipid-A-disaccharide synthase [Candidatus Omnitrophota bacterium]
MPNIKKIIIVCGEVSGDTNAANLTKEILKTDPGIKILAVGGENLRSAGARVFVDIKDYAIMGLFDVLKKLPRFFYLKKTILRKIKEEKPDAVILVDYSGFNLRLAAKINKSVPTIYYVSPQLWASRPKRIRFIKRFIHKVVVLFKFEEEFYRKHGISVDFVGHPLLDLVRPSMSNDKFIGTFGLSDSKVTVALLPGSRKQEIKYILPVMLKSAALIAKGSKGVQFIIAKSPNLEQEIYDRSIGRTNLDLKIIDGKTYDCLEAADFCLVASGTATLEAAIMQKPFAVIYKTNPLNYLVFKPQVRLPYIGMVNIVAKKLIIPEFLQSGANPQEIAEFALKVLRDPAVSARIKKELSKVSSSLGEKGASSRAAHSILTFLQK